MAVHMLLQIPLFCVCVLHKKLPRIRRKTQGSAGSHSHVSKAVASARALTPASLPAARDGPSGDSEAAARRKPRPCVPRVRCPPGRLPAGAQSVLSPRGRPGTRRPPLLPRPDPRPAGGRDVCGLQCGPRRPSSGAASQTARLGPHALAPCWLGSPGLAPSVPRPPVAGAGLRPNQGPHSDGSSRLTFRGPRRCERGPPGLFAKAVEAGGLRGPARGLIRVADLLSLAPGCDSLPQRHGPVCWPPGRRDSRKVSVTLGKGSAAGAAVWGPKGAPSPAEAQTSLDVARSPAPAPGRLVTALPAVLLRWQPAGPDPGQAGSG